MSRQKILVIDDEEKILESLRRELVFFAEKHNVELLAAGSAVRGLAILEKAHKDVAVVISDQRMPGMSGADFILRVKELYPDIISILLSAHTEIKELMKGIKAGIFSFILKPWNRDMLIAELEKALELYKLRVAKREYHDMIREELRWGGELQKTILKRVLPVSECIRFRVSYLPLPALNCGGDYYDVIDMGGGCYLALIGDVSGHGIKGAFVTAMLKSMIYSQYVVGRKDSGFSPAAFLCWLNNRVCAELEKIPDMLITFSACYLDLKTMGIKFAKAGHLPLAIVRQDQVKQYDAEGRGMGFAAGAVYEELSLPLSIGDWIILYTDGLLEYPGTGNASNFLDLSTVVPHVNDADEFHEGMIKNARLALQGGDFNDDVTLITAEVLGSKA